jgi:hypothetical protein
LLPRTIGLVKFIYKFIMVSETNRLQAESDGQKQRFSLFLLCRNAGFVPEMRISV